MDVYLVQHAQSKPKEEDPARPLTADGVKTIEKVASHCAKMKLSADQIYHSGKLRAQQTAEVLAKHLNAPNIVQAKAGLDPLDPVGPAKSWLEELAGRGLKSVAVVGHLPFLDKLASLLVAGNENAGIISFQNAGVVKLVPKSPGEGYCVQWILTAHQLVP